MRILSKLKSFFSKGHQQPQEQVTSTPSLPTENISSVNCVFCSTPIGIDDRVKQIGEHPLHKRCFKKVQRLLLEGKSMESIIAGQIQGIRKEVN